MVKVFKYVRAGYSTKTVAVELLEGCENHQEIIEKFAPATIMSQGFVWFREEYAVESSEVIKTSEKVLANGCRTYCKKGNEFKVYMDYNESCKLANNPKRTILFN